DWFRSHNLEFKPVVINNPDEAMRSYVAGRCDAFTTDKSGLATIRTTLATPEDHIILPEDFSKEPLGPMVRQGDDHGAQRLLGKIFGQNDVVFGGGQRGAYGTS